MADVPQIFDCLAAMNSVNPALIVQPHTAVSSLLFTTVDGGGFAIGFEPGGRTITVVAGDYFSFCPPLTSGIYGSFPAGSPPTEVTAMIGTVAADFGMT